MDFFLIIALIYGISDDDTLKFSTAILTPSTVSFTLCYLLSFRELKFTELYGTAILAPFLIVTLTLSLLDSFDEIEQFDKIRT